MLKLVWILIELGSLWTFLWLDCRSYHKISLHFLPPSTLPPPLVPLPCMVGNLFTPEQGGFTGNYVPPFKVYCELLQGMRCGYGCN